MTNHMASRLPFSMTGPTGSCHHDNQVGTRVVGPLTRNVPVQIIR